MRVGGRFEAERENGEKMRADRVVATPGLAPFPYIPSGVANCRLPSLWNYLHASRKCSKIPTEAKP